MKGAKGKDQVFSRHLTGKSASEHLSNFNKLLADLMGSSEGKPEVLDDVTVIEISHANFPALITASILGEFGAEVIKVEPPEGDPARTVSQYGVNVDGAGIPFVMESRNKQHITLDLKTEKGIENLKKIITQADLVVDGMKPGFLDSLGVGYRQCAELKPGLVYLAVSPYGHFTTKGKAYSNIPDTDLTAQSEAGYPALTGNPEAPEPYNYPVKAGVWAASYMAAALAVAGALTALLYKRKTGEGQMVDMASYDAISAWQGYSTIWGVNFRKPRVRVGNFDWIIFPYGYYKAKDGFVTIAAGADQDFRGLLKIFKRWDLENDWRFVFDRITDDLDKLKLLEADFKKEIVKFTRAELVQRTLSFSQKAARDKLRAQGSPIAVQTLSPREVLNEEHWKIRKSFMEFAVGETKIKMPAPAPKLSDTPLRLKKVECGLGAHNRQVFQKFGLKE
jgi:crotonobetainyl-CoA:carnitine CoA-transferase CaiB-like acyl-CoA transferase